jgi:hypothetical protein
MEKNHKNLKSNVDFESLPEWFKTAKTKDAVIISENNYLTFKSGTWLNGLWKNGRWEYGILEDGIWEDGIWEDGIWVNGIDRIRY